MRCCKRVTDATFMHLRGIDTLCMGACNQETITDAAFVHLGGIQSLDMMGYNQWTITDAAFVHLRGICAKSNRLTCRSVTRRASLALPSSTCVEFALSKPTNALPLAACTAVLALGPL